MRFNLFFLIVMVTVFGCLRSGECFSTRDKAYGHASSRAAKILEREYGIHCCGSGCMTNEYIEKISLSFQIYQELEIDEARKLIVSLASRYLEILNTDHVLRPLMVKYPFDEENIRLTLFFRTKQRDNVWHPKISVASLNMKTFCFCTHEKNNIYSYVDEIYEPYSESLEKAGFTKPNDQSMSK